MLYESHIKFTILIQNYVMFTVIRNCDLDLVQCKLTFLGYATWAYYEIRSSIV